MPKQMCAHSESNSEMYVHNYIFCVQLVNLGLLLYTYDVCVCVMFIC